MEPQIQFTRTSDGARIAYMRIGTGRHVLYSRFGGVSMAHKLALEDPWLRMLAAAATVTTFDRQGTGASQRYPADLTPSAQIRELEAVAACVPAARFTLIAGGADAPAAAGYAAAHPERVDHLVCVNPAPTDPRQWSQDFLRENWSMSRRYVAQHLFPDGPVELQKRYSRAMADAVDHETYVRISAEWRSPDVVLHYRDVRIPTLVIQRVKDEAARERLQPIIDALPDCNLVLLGDRRGPEAAREELAAVVKFTGIEVPEDEPRAATETVVIMFADVVDSTAVTEHVGDMKFRARSRELDEALRKLIRSRRGETIDGKLLGDGVLAAFRSAADAIEAALACGPAARTVGLELHIGLHAGDVLRESDNVYGGAVNIASRICALCEPGEVLVSQTVRDLARTSAGVTFEDRGEHALKGIADPVRVFAVRPAE